MGAFADHTLHDLLDAVAAQRPAPGGGCSAAWAASMGAGLVEMAASFTLARPRYAGVHRRMLDVRKEATGLRRRLVELAESDAETYEAVVAAMRLPAQHPDRRQLLDDARSQAAETPMAITEAAADVAELAAETARSGNEHLEGDATTGALLAEGACRAAARLVEINLAQRPDDPRLARVAEAVRRAASARDGALRARQEALS
ncbi:MAG: glutamate formiminotransferase / formiminotetrahydrofolate cyclodeaminase [Solirubrobacteraceae bacterium]|jgi:formiminotetrahydrofolate cyclodeaminase|nr:glutamate formiminotransferase / formiminotetrahydrofolate cyclodeaminase [Solirubrobacteraceae bacterium]MEA2323947.1 glutamate formiminotransferase / formiminotetrahydrofolate cyclodeaminase [Solirubrobacteraceae bacterium]